MRKVPSQERALPAICVVGCKISSVSFVSASIDTLLLERGILGAEFAHEKGVIIDQSSKCLDKSDFAFWQLNEKPRSPLPK